MKEHDANADKGRVLTDRERLERLERTVQILLSDLQRRAKAKVPAKPKPDIEAGVASGEGASSPQPEEAEEAHAE